MSLRRWLSKIRVEGERGVLKRKGLWGDNFQTLEVLLAHLQLCTFTHFSVDVRLASKFQGKSVNVDELVQRVRRAYFVLHQEGDVDRDPVSMKEFETMTLDRFLLNNQDFPIRPEDVVTVLGEAVSQFAQQMGILIAEESDRVAYYQRQYTALLAEVRELFETLIAASDLYQSHKTS